MVVYSFFIVNFRVNQSLICAVIFKTGCGYSIVNAAGRIVGGQEVNPRHKLPYQVYVQVCSDLNSLIKSMYRHVQSYSPLSSLRTGMYSHILPYQVYV